MTRRCSSLLASLALVSLSACNCEGIDPPEGDAGPGEQGAVTGLLLGQRADGVLLELDLESGTARAPLGDVSVAGGVTAYDGRLLMGSEHLGEEGSFWAFRVAGFDPDSKQATPYARSRVRGGTLAAHDGRLAASFTVGGLLTEGPLDGDLEDLDLPSGSAVAYNSEGELIVSTSVGTRLLSEDSEFADEHCGALLQHDGELFCGLADGSAIVNLSSGLPQLTEEGEPFASLSTVDGAVVGVRHDGTLAGFASMPESDIASLKPRQLANLDGRTYFGADHGGLYQIGGGLVYAVLGGTFHAEGLATGGGRLAIGGQEGSGVFVMGRDFSAPRLTSQLERGRALLFGDDGSLFAADEEGVRRFAPDELEHELLLDDDEAVGLALLEGVLYLARGEAGLSSLSLDEPLADEATPLETARADLLVSCGGELVAYDEQQDALWVYEPTAGEDGLLEQVSDELGVPTSLGCVNEQLVVATEEGELYGRPAGARGPAFALAVVTDAPLLHLASGE